MPRPASRLNLLGTRMSATHQSVPWLTRHPTGTTYVRTHPSADTLELADRITNRYGLRVEIRNRSAVREGLPTLR